MATNLNIDEKLLSEALQVSGKKTKREAVNDALAEYIARRKQKKILDLFGTIDFQPRYDYKRAPAPVKFIVDTCVWSLALRRNTSNKDQLTIWLENAIQSSQSIFLLGVILQELLQGVKEPARFQKLKRLLEPFPILEPQRQDYVYAAELSNVCRASGVQASTIDFLIASVAIHHDCYLVTSDRDFTNIARVAPLKLVKK